MKSLSSALSYTYMTMALDITCQNWCGLSSHCLLFCKCLLWREPASGNRTPHYHQGSLRDQKSTFLLRFQQAIDWIIFITLLTLCYHFLMMEVGGGVVIFVLLLLWSLFRLFYYFYFHSCLSSLTSPHKGRLDLNNIYLSVEGWILIIFNWLWKAGWCLMRHRKYENVPSGPGVQLSPRHELLCN